MIEPKEPVNGEVSYVKEFASPKVLAYGKDGRTISPDAIRAAEIAAQSKPASATVKPTNPKDLIGIRKAPLSVIPTVVLYEVGLGMLEGAVKYGRHNYRAAGVRASVYYDASVGHLNDWWEGEDIDPDSGLNHVTKAIASLFVLRDAMIQEMLTDDRPPRSKMTKRHFNEMAGAIIDKHADKHPRHWTLKDVIAKLP